MNTEKYNLSVKRIFEIDKNPIDYLYKNEIEIAEVTLVAVFDDQGKYSHNRYKVIKPAFNIEKNKYNAYKECLALCEEYNEKIIERGKK
jgi:hypothetical protein